MKIFSTLIPLVAIGLLGSGCSGLFYYPSKETYFDPIKYFATQPEDLTLELSSSEKVHGWRFSSPQKPSKGTIIFFHGNAENLTSHYVMLIWVQKQGYDLVIFDYPGYGQSEGRPDQISTVETGKAFIRWAHSNFPKPLFVYGHSLGGVIALKAIEELKNEMRPKAVIISSSFRSYKEIAKEKLAESWVTWPLQWLSYLVISDQGKPENLGRLSPIPLLLIHGQIDSIVPVRFSQQMYEEALEPKSLWIIEKGNHTNLFLVEEGLYQKKLLEFLNNLSSD